MTTRDRLVLIGVVVLVVLAGGFLLVVSPERKQAAQAQTQVQSARQQLETAEAQDTSAQAAEQRYTAAYSSVVSLGKAVPPATEVPALIYELDQASNQHDVNFNSISTGTGGSSGAASSSSAAAAATASATPAGFTQMPFTFVFKGSFQGLARLLGKIDGFVQRNTAGNVLVNGRLLTIQGADITVESPSSASAGGTSASSSKSKPSAPLLSATITATAYVLPAGQGLTGGATPIAPAPASASPSSSSSAPAAAAVIKVTP
ncbi:MAG: type II secretion system protein GspM [Solirubrobacteraceae bacterium]